MELGMNTAEFTSNAVSAYREYKSGNYQKALPILQDVLDFEPDNWMARLLLGVCFYKCGQPMASVRAFRLVYERCQESPIKQKACLALQAVTATLQKHNIEMPLEWGDAIARNERPVQPLELIVNA